MLLGGHDVPSDKVISRYFGCIKLMKEVIDVCDICHVYDNSTQNPMRIFKKRKSECFYDDCESSFFEVNKTYTSYAKERKS